MADNTFLFKPVSEKGSLVVLTPTALKGKIAGVEIIDSNGKVLESGNYTGQGNGDRGHFRFRNKGNAYAGGQIRINFDDGSAPISLDVGSGERFKQTFNSQGLPQGNITLEPSGSGSLRNAGISYSSKPTPSTSTSSIMPEGSPSPSPSGGFAGVNMDQLAGAEYPFVLPGSAPWGSLPTPYIDLQANLNLAREQGTLNRDMALENVGLARDPALGAVATDIAGTTIGLESFVPRVRAEEQTEQQAYIDRAGMIDEANLSRIPAFNVFNRQQVEQANLDRIQAHKTSIESSGLDFRKRSRDILDQLTKRAKTGRLPEGMDESLSAELANRGADIGRASGISAISGAGVRASDRLTIGERTNLMLDAEKQLPDRLLQFQQTLQAPQEIAPTLTAQPTQIPLKQSTVSERMPIVPNISAGASQLNLAAQATQYQAIPAQAVLSSGLQTDQFNQTSAYNRALTVLDKEQGFINATNNAYQGAINAQRQDDVRQQQFEMYMEGQETLRRAQEEQARGRRRGRQDALDELAGLGRTPSDSDTVIRMPDGTTMELPGEPNGSLLPSEDEPTFTDRILEGIDAALDIAGGEDGKISIGDATIDVDKVRSGVRRVMDLFYPTAPSSSPSTPSSGIAMDDWGQYFPDDTEDNSYVKSLINPNSRTGMPNFDKQTLNRANNLVANWGKMDSTQQAYGVSGLGIDILRNAGVITPQTADKLNKLRGSFYDLMNPDASPVTQAAAFAELSASYMQTAYTGNINSPTSIGGNPVVGSAEMPDGSEGFQVMKPSGEVDIVSKAELLNTANTASALEAVRIVSSNMPTEDKLRALTSIGISAAEANNILSKTQAGSAMSILALFDTVDNFKDMNDVQKVASVSNLGNSIINTLQASGVKGLGAANSAFATAGAAASAYMGTDLAIKTIESLDSIPRSQSLKVGTVNMAAAGAQIGYAIGSFTPLGPLGGTAIGTAVGAVTGATLSTFGTGKDTVQKQRDLWRKGMKEAGFAGEDFTVTLANGSTYDIGLDGREELKNKGTNLDGRSTRYTFDVDWSNPVAVNSIPEAHIFALATGLDPTSNEKFDFFNTAVAQSLNAATSNANTVEGVRSNFKSMLESAGVSYADLAMRIESLRLAHKISDSEYNTYIDKVNNMYGTRITPTSRQEATNYYIQQIEAIPAKDRNDQLNELYSLLTNDKKLREAEERLNKRVGA